MPATIQKILKPSKYRALDTSTSEQETYDIQTDGEFNGADDTNWSTGTAASISGGYAIVSDSGGNSGNIVQGFNTGLQKGAGARGIKRGDRYRVQMVVEDPDSGTFDGRVRVALYSESPGGVGGDNFRGFSSYLTSAGTVDQIITVSQDNTGNYHDSIVLENSSDPCNFKIASVKVTKLEFFGNNNHGQIYSGRGLEFDGASDSLTVPTTVLDGQDYQNGTIAAWVNFNTYSTGDRIFSHFDDSSARMYLFVNSTNKSLRYQIGNSSAADGTEGSIQLNTWYRVVMAWNSSGNVYIYINGILDTTASGIDMSGFASLNNNATSWGSHNGNDNFLDGMMSDAQLWNTTWTQSDATYDYNNPESLALSNGGTSLTEFNLKVWYPMQDGHRGQQSYIMDGAGTGLGDEMAIDGNFDNNDASWTTSSNNDTTVTIANNSVTMTNNGTAGFGSVAQSSTDFLSNVTYKLTFNVTSVSGGTVALYNYNTNLTESLSPTSVPVTVVDYFSGDGTNGIDIRATLDNGESVTIDNISVKPVNDKHHATTVFMGDNLYTAANAMKVAADGTTADETDATTGWSSNGTSTFTTSSTSHSGSKSIVYEANVNHGGIKTDLQPYLTAGRTYKLSLFVRHTTGGTGASIQSIRFSSSSNLLSDVDEISQVLPSEDTFHEVTKEFVYDDDEYRYFGVKELNGDGATGDGGLFMDTMYIKEVGVASGWTDADQQLDIPQTALQSYNQLAWFSGGSTSHVQLSGDITKNPHNSNVSFSFNVMRNITTDQHMVICDEDTTSLRKIRFTEDGKILIESNTNEDNVQATLSVNDKNWHHYVVTCNSGVVKFYQDGKLLTNTNENTIDDAITLRRIGKGTSKGMEGCITECAIWDVTLSQLEVNELYNDGKTLDARLHSENTNLAHYWKNNGLAIWTDLAGKKDGTPTNIEETILLPSGVDSSRDTQGFSMNRQKNTNSLNLYYDGTTAIGKGPRIFTSSAPIETYTACSFSCWVKMQNKNALSTIFSIGTSDTNHIHVAVEGNDDGKILWTYDLNQTNQRYETANAAINALDTWFHVVCVCDNSQSNDYDKLKVYVNGSISANSTDATLNTGTVQSITPDESQFEIGSNPHSARKLTGQIDDFLIYNDILTTTEITRIYNAGKRSHR